MLNTPHIDWCFHKFDPRISQLLKNVVINRDDHQCESQTDYCAQNRDVDECEPQTRHPAPSQEQEGQPGG